jgi:FixJ family two-component response regulator
MKTITVVDDDPGLRDAFRVIFDQNSFTVNIYPDGEPILANECPVPDIYCKRRTPFITWADFH